MTNPPQDDELSGDLTLGIRGVSAAQPAEDGSMALRIETTRGPLEGVFHPVEGGTGAVVCVGGASGGIDGPADGLYGRLPGLLAEHRVSVLRLEYRYPDNLQECALDVLGGCSFLKGIGATDVVLVGHSFGGAVVISAGELAPIVRGVVSMSPQLFGTSRVEHLGSPLLLVHGMSDSVLGHDASEDICRRASEPTRIVLYAEAGHTLLQARDAIDALLLEWIPARLAGEPMESGRDEHAPGTHDNQA